jgi:hypothetical protein
MLNRIPFQEIVTNPGDEYSYIIATKGEGYIMVYSPLGNDIELNGNLLNAVTYTVSWYDPRSGKTNSPGTVQKQPVMKFSPPSRGPGFDWVLILDEKK